MLNIMSLRNCKLKQCDTTTYLLEWLESKTLAIPKGGKDVEQQELSHLLLVGRQSVAATLENILKVSYKTKHTLILPCDPAIILLGIYLKSWKVIYTQKHMKKLYTHADVYGSCIHNSQKL